MQQIASNIGAAAGQVVASGALDSVGLAGMGTVAAVGVYAAARVAQDRRNRMSQIMDRQQRQNMEQMVNGDPRPPPSRWQAIRDRLQEIVAPAPMPLEDRAEEQPQEPQEPRQRRRFGLSPQEFRRRQGRQAPAAPVAPPVALQPPVPERRVHGLTREQFQRLTRVERDMLDQREARERTDGRTGGR